MAHPIATAVQLPCTGADFSLQWFTGTHPQYAASYPSHMLPHASACPYMSTINREQQEANQQYSYETCVVSEKMPVSRSSWHWFQHRMQQAMVPLLLHRINYWWDCASSCCSASYHLCIRVPRRKDNTLVFRITCCALQVGCWLYFSGCNTRRVTFDVPEPCFASCWVCLLTYMPCSDGVCSGSAVSFHGDTGQQVPIVPQGKAGSYLLQVHLSNV